MLHANQRCWLLAAAHGPPMHLPPPFAAQVQDNFWDVAPPLLFFTGLVAFVKHKRQEILLHHRA